MGSAEGEECSLLRGCGTGPGISCALLDEGENQVKSCLVALPEEQDPGQLLVCKADPEFQCLEGCSAGLALGE